MIFFEQAQPVKGRELHILNQEWFILTMNKAFGSFPCELTKDHLDKLAGMSACWGETATDPYAEMARAIRRLGSIKVWSKFDAFEPKNGTEETP